MWHCDKSAQMHHTHAFACQLKFRTPQQTRALMKKKRSKMAYKWARRMIKIFRIYWTVSPGKQINTMEEWNELPLSMHCYMGWIDIAISYACHVDCDYDSIHCAIVFFSGAYSKHNWYFLHRLKGHKRHFSNANGHTEPINAQMTFICDRWIIRPQEIGLKWSK